MEGFSKYIDGYFEFEWIDYVFRKLSSLWGLVFLFVLKELFELIKLILWCSNNQTYHLDYWGILRFSWCGVSILRSLGFHLVRWRVKAQPILSTRSWGSKPSLLLGFITIVGGVHISINIKTTSFDKPQVTNKQQKPTVILEDKSPNS